MFVEALEVFISVYIQILILHTPVKRYSDSELAYFVSLRECGLRPAFFAYQMRRWPSAVNFSADEQTCFGHRMTDEQPPH